MLRAVKPGAEMSRMPKILHFYLGFKEGFGGRQWGLSQYVSVRGVIEQIKPELSEDYGLEGPRFDTRGPGKVEFVQQYAKMIIRDIKHRMLSTAW